MWYRKWPGSHRFDLKVVYFDYKAFLNTQSISVFLLNRLMCMIHIGRSKYVWGKLGQKGLNWGSYYHAYI